MDERVLVIPASHFESLGSFTGFKPADDRFRADLCDARACSFRPRCDVEQDPFFKQLIPYVVLRCDGKIFHYQRGQGGGEQRLAAKRSIGIGGHISDADAAGDGQPYRNGMLRELFEEVEIDCPFAEVHFGFLYDPGTPVGQVHVGVVHLLELAEMKVTPKETGIISRGFASPAQLIAERDQFESWSQLVLDELASAE